MSNMFLGFPVARAKIADMISTSAPPANHHTQHENAGSDEIDVTDLVGAGGISFPFTDIYFSLLFESSTGYEVYLVGSAYSEVTAWGLELATDVTSSSSASAYKRVHQVNPALSWDKNRQFVIHTYYSSDADEVATMWMITGEPGTSRHVGFYVANGILYGTVGDGSSQTTVALLTLGVAAWEYIHSLKALWSPATKAEFYIDGTKIDEITTGLPSGETSADQILYLSVENLTSANDKSIQPGNWTFWQAP